MQISANKQQIQVFLFGIFWNCFFIFLSYTVVEFTVWNPQIQMANCVEHFHHLQSFLMLPFRNFSP